MTWNKHILSVNLTKKELFPACVFIQKIEGWVIMLGTLDI